MLFSAFGVSMTFAAPMNATEISFYQAENTLFAQSSDVDFAVRAPLLAVSNVEVTGGVSVMQGSAFALHGHETVTAVFGFERSSNAPNTGLPVKPLVDPATNLASPQRTQHILHGDATGGGHLWPGSAGKTPFPQNWDANKVMNTTSDLATNPNLSWKPQTGNGGLYTKSGKPARFVLTDANGNLPVVDGVPVRVIIEPAGEGIITAYPKY